MLAWKGAKFSRCCTNHGSTGCLGRLPKSISRTMFWMFSGRDSRFYVLRFCIASVFFHIHGSNLGFSFLPVPCALKCALLVFSACPVPPTKICCLNSLVFAQELEESSSCLFLFLRFWAKSLQTWSGAARKPVRRTELWPNKRRLWRSAVPGCCRYLWLVHWIDAAWDLALCCVCLPGSAGVEPRGPSPAATPRCVHDMFDGL